MLAGKTVSDMGNCWEILWDMLDSERQSAGGTPLGCPRKPSSSRSSTKLLASGDDTNYNGDVIAKDRRYNGEVFFRWR